MVRPIEIQDVLSKTPAAEKVQQVRQTAPDVQQRQLAQELEAQAANRHERVEDPEQGDQVTLSGNQYDERDLGHREDDGEPRDPQQESEPNEGDEGGLIDFRV